MGGVPDGGRPSLLEQLKARRQELLDDLVTDVPVPLVQPKVTLRVRPVSHETISKQLARREKAKTPEARAEVDLAANASIIAAGVVEVVLGEGDDAETCNLKTVAEVFELGDGAKAADAIRALFARDGDVLVAGGKVMRHSGYADAEADEGFAGES